jgi:hypothetical protein
MLDFGMEFVRNNRFSLTGFIDLDWARSLDYMKFTLVYFFNLCSSNVSYTCKKLTMISLLSTKAEYKDAIGIVCEVVCLRRILEDTTVWWSDATPLYCENPRVLKLIKNSICHSKRMHIEIHHQFI